MIVYCTVDFEVKGKLDQSMTDEREARNHQPKMWKLILRSLPLLGMLCAAGYLIFSGENISAQYLAEFTPASYPLAIGFFLLAYALKTLSLVFPLAVLFIAAGMVFPIWLALLVNVCGLVLSMVMGYFIGLLSGSGLADRLMTNYPRLQALKTLRQRSVFLFSYTVRAVGIFACDLVSMYMGAVQAPFRPFLLGSLLGLAPGMLAQTLLGTTILKPGSPLFWVFAIGAVVIAIGSSLLYYYYVRKKGTRSNQDGAEEKNEE